ncbi:molybdopterin cofactor-binding domain-containing protein [Pseudoroseomonas wenyumeiae]
MSRPGCCQPRRKRASSRSGEPAPPAAHSVAARFTRPFLAHGSIGTCCAVALWREDALEVWTHSQGIYNLRADLSTVLGLPPEQIILHHVEAAGCYGHNGADDVALDAALCARAHPGRPVRALWSRAEELAWGPLSPPAWRRSRRRWMRRAGFAAGARCCGATAIPPAPAAPRTRHCWRRPISTRPLRIPWPSTRRWRQVAGASAMLCRATRCRRWMSACTGCWRCRSAVRPCARWAGC